MPGKASESMLSVMMSRMNPSFCLGGGDFRLSVVDKDEVRHDNIGAPCSIIDRKSSPRSYALLRKNNESSSMADLVQASSACSIIDCSIFGPDNELYLKKIDDLWDNTFKYHPVDDNDDTCNNNVAAAESNNDEMETTGFHHLRQVVPTLLSRISAKYPTPSPVPRINSTDLAKCTDPATAIIRQKTQNECDVYGSEALQELHDLTITTTTTTTTTNNRKNDRGGKKGVLINYYRILMIHRSDICGDNIVEVLSRVLVGRSSSSSSSIGDRHSMKKNENYSSYGVSGGHEDEESFDNSLDDSLLGVGNKVSSAQHRQRTASGRYGPSSLANEDRRLACWTLCNLAMPHENKPTMLLPSSPFLSLPSIVSSSMDERGIKNLIRGGEGEQQDDRLLLQALTCVIGRNLPESYLCLICLLNLAYCTENARRVVYYIPTTTIVRRQRKLNIDNNDDNKTQKRIPLTSLCASRIRSRSEPVIVSRTNGGGCNDVDQTKMSEPSTMPRRGILLNILDKVGNGSVVPSHRAGILSSIDNDLLSTIDHLVLCNPSSLLRIIERSMNTNYLYAFGSVQSVQGEAIRWACGLIRNLTRTTSTTVVRGGREDNAAEEVCTLISQTTIPKLLIHLISTSPRSSIEWTRNSLEDACLGAMCNMAIWPRGLEALRLAGVAESKCLQDLENVPGIHGYRAKALQCSLVHFLDKKF